MYVMVKPNQYFKLSVQDIEMLEAALFKEIAAISHRLLYESDQQSIEQLHRLQQLLGRIHNQKCWYHHYIGG